MSTLASTTVFPRVVRRGNCRASGIRVVTARAHASTPTPSTSLSKRSGHKSNVSSAIVSSATLTTCAPSFASTQLTDVALSDAWFGWYFAPGGVVLGPAVFFAVWILGQAAFEKITGKGKGQK